MNEIGHHQFFLTHVIDMAKLIPHWIFLNRRIQTVKKRKLLITFFIQEANYQPEAVNTPTLCRVIDLLNRFSHKEAFEQSFSIFHGLEKMERVRVKG